MLTAELSPSRAKLVHLTCLTCGKTDQPGKSMVSKEQEGGGSSHCSELRTEGEFSLGQVRDLPRYSGRGWNIQNSSEGSFERNYRVVMHESLKLCCAKSADTEKTCKLAGPRDPQKRHVCDMGQQGTRGRGHEAQGVCSVVRHAHTKIKTENLFSKTKHLCKFHPALLEGCLVSWR